MTGADHGPEESSAATADDDTPKEACGVFAVHAPGQPASHLTYLGLYALQHRGQESAGMAVSDGVSVTVVREMGLVSNVFDDRTLAALPGHVAIGHTRYSTTGSSNWNNSQPVYRDVGGRIFSVAHNGNLVNTAALSDRAGLLAGTATSDTHVLSELIAAEMTAGESTTGFTDAVVAVLPLLEGAFSLVFMDETTIVGARDRNGFRPLCLGRIGEDGWVLASESPALDVVGASFVREIEPGETVIIDGDGVRSEFPFAAEQIDPRLCLFEFVYFARPDSTLLGRSVHQARVRMGEELADQAPLEPRGDVDDTLVMGVPESGIPAAEGYARRSGLPFGHGLVKNRYIGRTFIAPTQAMRSLGVRMKLNPLRENIAGKRLVVVDDSIVRGTTTQSMVAMLRDAGAAEIHMRVSSPPYRWPCFYGMDTGAREELLAARMEVEEIREHLGADTLAYLDIDRLMTATGVAAPVFCTACLTGEYPVAVPVDLHKGVMEPVPSDLPTGASS